MMKDDIEEIIKKLEKVQNLLDRNQNSEASIAAYEAQIMAIYLRDHINNG